MTYDPTSNALLAAAKCSRGQQWAAAAATGIAVGAFWYLAVALRVGA